MPLLPITIKNSASAAELVLLIYRGNLHLQHLNWVCFSYFNTGIKQAHLILLPVSIQLTLLFIPYKENEYFCAGTT